MANPMNVLIRAALLLWLAAATSAIAQPAAASRLVVPFDRDWTFNYFPSTDLAEPTAAPAFDDSRWPAVALPHSWSTFETTGDVHPFIKSASERDDPYWWRGWGWYRKRFTLAAAEARHAHLEFDGVQKHARLYIDGRFVAEHKGGYDSWSVDISPHVRPGVEAVIALAVSNRRDDPTAIAPMTAGNFNVYGGIYRPVRLVLKDPLHIPYQGNAGHEGGTFVTTPRVEAASADVRIRTFVRNDGAAPRRAVLATTIADPSGRIVAKGQQEREITPGATVAFDETLTVAHPMLWSVGAPQLYRVASTVRHDGRETDRLESPLGIRTFHWDKTADRLVVNGAPMKIVGTNRHQEYPWLGDAMPRWLHERELREVRTTLGHNFMRAGHYPNDPLVYALADRLGMVIAEEVPNIKPIDFDEAVQDANLRSMIRRDRNHPSIMFWSMGNETSDSADSCTARQEDPTRLIHQRKSENYGDCVDHDHRDLDMEALLRVTIRGWTDRDVRNLEPVNSAALPKSGQTAGTEEWQHVQARVADGSIRGRVDQQVVAWLYADHGADRDYENAPLRNVNAKGWVDLYRVPKYMYHLWRANHAPEPSLFLHPHHWQARYLGQNRDFQVDSNCAEVALAVNGREVGRMQPTAAEFFTVRFSAIAIARGTIEARCTDRAGLVSRVTMAGAPAELRLGAEHDALPADRSGIAILTADIVDAKGVRVQAATNPLRWEVVGPARLVGPADYATDIAKTLAAEGQGYVTTPVKNLVRTTAEPGTIRVRVTSPGLRAAELTLRATRPTPIAGPVHQPPLHDAGRLRVVRDATFDPVREAVANSPTLARIEDENHSFPGLAGPALRKAITDFVRARNAALDPREPAFAALIERLAGAVERTNRQLIPDDYNFAGRRFDDAMRLATYIDATRLHPAYREAMKRHYADTVITRGRSIDEAAERARLAPLLEGSRMIRLVSDGPTPVAYQKTRDFYDVIAATPAELLGRMVPDLAARPADERQAALVALARANPTAIGIRDGAHAFVSGKWVLLPPADALAAPR